MYTVQGEGQAVYPHAYPMAHSQSGIKRVLNTPYMANPLNFFENLFSFVLKIDHLTLSCLGDFTNKQCMGTLKLKTVLRGLGLKKANDLNFFENFKTKNSLHPFYHR